MAWGDPNAYINTSSCALNVKLFSLKYHNVDSFSYWLSWYFLKDVNIYPCGFFQIDLFYFMHMNMLPACYVCTPLMCSTHGGQKRMWIPGLKLWMVVSYHVTARNWAWTLQEQRVLMVPPPPQPQHFLWLVPCDTVTALTLSKQMPRTVTSTATCLRGITFV